MNKAITITERKKDDHLMFEFNGVKTAKRTHTFIFKNRHDVEIEGTINPNSVLDTYYTLKHIEGLKEMYVYDEDGRMVQAFLK